jgi:prophage antirepressor-like protein
MERIMDTITFNDVELHLQTHPQHEFLLTNKEVALGYGTTIQSLNQAKTYNKDELIEGKHWLRLEVQTRGGKQSVIHWTKKGIVRLGFFIKSQKAKAFRDWAEDYIVNQPNTQEHNPHQIGGYKSQLAQKNKKIAQLEARITQLQDPEMIASTVVRALQGNQKLQTENQQLKEKMKQQLSLIVTNVSDEIVTRFEESLDVTARGIELRK